MLNWAFTQRMSAILVDDMIAKLNESKLLSDEQKKQLQSLKPRNPNDNSTTRKIN